MRFAKCFAWLVWAIAASYFFYDYLQQVIPNVIGLDVMHDFHITAATFSLIAASYYLIYAIMQIPVGLIIDHFGPHKPLVAAVFIAAVSVFITSMAPSAIWLGIFRFTTGLGASFSFVTCLKLVSNWFSENEFGFLTGLTNLVGMLGAVFGGAPMSRFVEAFGWRAMMGVLGALGIVLMILIIIIVRDRPKQALKKPSPERSAQKTLSDLLHIIKMPQAWINGIYAFMINLPFPVLGALWGNAFLVRLCHVPQVKAAFMTSLLFIGGIFGSFILGWLSDHCHRRKIFMTASSLITLILFAILIYFSSMSILMAEILLFAIGFFACGNVVAYAFSHDIRPPGSAGVSLGFINTCLIGGSALSQPFVGWLITHFSTGMPNLLDFRLALSSVTVGLLIALVLSFFLKETFCRSVY